MDEQHSSKVYDGGSSPPRDTNIGDYMKQKIFKYILKPEDLQIIEVPKNSILISAEEQFEGIVVYAQFHPEDENRLEERLIRVVGTGKEIEYEGMLMFIDTVKMYGGTLMFHVYEQR